MKKLFNFKNIMFVLCVGIAIISTFFSCEVRAYSWDEFKTWISDYTNQSSLSNDTKEVCNYINSRLTIIENNLPNINQCNNFYAYRVYNYRDYYYSYYFYAWKGNSYTYNNNSLYWVNNGVQWIGLDSVYSNINNYRWYTNFSGQNMNKSGFSGSLGLLENEPTSTISNQYYFNYVYPATPPFIFTPYGFLLSGDSATYWNKFAYVSGFIPLGLLGDNSYYQLDIKLRDENGYDIGNYSDVPGVGSISDDNGRILKVENGVVSVNAIYLAYYRNYNLLFKVWSDENTFESYIYAYQFMPFSAVVQNGQIVSSGDTTFSGVDSTILITDNLNDYSNVDDILSGYLGLGGLFASGDINFSGDVDFNVSGDLFTLLGYSDYDNDYKNFVYNGIYHNLKDVFLSSNDREFSFLFMGRNITINSNSFTTPNGVLKTFVSSFLVFGTIYYFYKTTIHFYHKMQEGNQLEAVETWSVDDESILM